MKILAIIGSPRRGNSYKTTQVMEEKLKSLGDVEFEYLFLKDTHLGQCVGCNTCVINGEDTCPLKDDRANIADKMMKADGVIFVTPVYNFHITSLMKNFVDHFTYLVHRPRMFKKQGFIFVQRGVLFRDAVKYMEKVTKSWGFNIAGRLGMAELSENSAKRLKEVEKIGKLMEDFYDAVKTHRIKSPSLYDLIWFRMWRMNAVGFKDIMKADHRYWTDQEWLKRNYYYDVSINPLKMAAVNLIEKIMAFAFKRMFR